jgi:hypothetical protein
MAKMALKSRRLKWPRAKKTVARRSKPPMCSAKLPATVVGGVSFGKSQLTRVDKFLEPLEARRFCDSPLEGLSYALFAAPSFVLGTPGLFGQISSAALDEPQTFSSNPVTGANTPFEAVYTGTLSLTAEQAGTYYFQLPQAEGAILTIDGQTIIFAPSLAGDANLDGNVDINDLNIVFSNYLRGYPTTWATGDFTGDGKTDINDLNVVFNNIFDPVTPTVIDNSNAADDNPYGLTLGVNLSAGNHNIQLDYFQYNDNTGGQTPEALLQWMTSSTGSYSGMSGLTLSPYKTPVVTPVSSASGIVGTALGNQTIGTFTASAPGTLPTDYAATIAWSDSTSETANVIANGNGFAVQSNRTLPTSAGPLTGMLTVTHNLSGFSNLPVQVSVAVKLPAPANVHALKGDTSSNVLVSWTRAPGSVQTLVERSTNSGSTWTSLATVSNTTADSAGNCSYLDTSVPSGTTPQYCVTSEDGTSPDGRGDDLNTTGMTSSPVNTMVVSLNTSVTDMGPQHVVGETRVGGNGNLYSASEYDVGSNSDDLTYGYTVWDSSGLSNGFDTGPVQMSLNAEAAGSILTVGGAMDGPLSSGSGTGGAIHQVAIRVDALNPYMDAKLTGITLEFYDNGILTESESVPNLEAQTTQDEPMMENLAVVTPSSNTDDQVIVSATMEFASPVPYQLPDVNDMFAQINVS